MMLSRPRFLHVLLTVVLAILMFPLLRHFNLPTTFAWYEFLRQYWVTLGIESLLLSIVLYALGNPRDLIAALADRGQRIPFPDRQVLAIFVPAAYFFVVFFLVLAYNDIIAAARFDGSGDALLLSADSFLLHGHAVRDLAHWAASHLSTAQIELLEVVYFGMFPQIGAAIVLLGMKEGFGRAWHFVGALSTAYYIALLLFWLIPATGPYYGCIDHGSAWSSEFMVVQSQGFFVQTLKNIGHLARANIGTDYFIALPCMHLVQPLIVLWFLRSNRRVLWALAVYDVILVASILLLEQHYAVDLLGAIPVAVFAVMLSDPHSGAGASLRLRSAQTQTPAQESLAAESGQK